MVSVTLGRQWRRRRPDSETQAQAKVCAASSPRCGLDILGRPASGQGPVQCHGSLCPHLRCSGDSSTQHSVSSKGCTPLLANKGPLWASPHPISETLSSSGPGEPECIRGKRGFCPGPWLHPLGFGAAQHGRAELLTLCQVLGSKGRRLGPSLFGPLAAHPSLALCHLLKALPLPGAPGWT